MNKKAQSQGPRVVVRVGVSPRQSHLAHFENSKVPRSRSPKRDASLRYLRRLALVVGCLALAWLILPPPPPLDGTPYSQRVLDRDGRLLRLTLAADEKYRLHTPLAQVSPELQAVTLFQEDQFFWRHAGINPVAALRSVVHVAAGNRGRGGASTITMQLARLRYHLHTRTIAGKLEQMYRAAQLERHYTKPQILEAYFNLAPYGGNIEGIGAASYLYLGKAPSVLTKQEALTFCVLPQSPTRRAPRGTGENPSLRAAANRLAARYAPEMGEIETGLSLRNHESIAPHFVRRVLNADRAGEVTTTLDRSLQRLVEGRLTDGLTSASRYGVKNAAALLLDFRSMEVLAQAGSADFFNTDISGQVDGTRSRRSPGSTLKPFIYALAMDQGLIHPQTMLADLPRRFSAYRPENFDGDFAGPLSATDALARSRNVPAVELSSRLARPSLYEFLKSGGVALPREEAYYGLSLPLGGGEVTMEELVRLYAMLANGGRLRPIHRELQHPAAIGGPRLLTPEASFLTLQMLGRVPRPVLDSPAGDDGVYWKTGTSMGFRDAWAVGVFDHYVLAVWVGNFDGERNPAFIGRTCAGPLLFRIIDAMKAEGRATPRQLPPPEGANLRQVELCAVTGHLPNASCPHRTIGWFIPGVSPIAACEVHREIIVDAESGLRLSQDDGTSAVRREVYEFWPSEFQALFESAGLPRRRPPPFAPGAGIETSGRSGHPPRILSPANGQVYARPSAEQPVMLCASTEAEVRKIYWFAGKAFLGAATPKEPLAWYPVPGEYRLVAIDDHGRSTSARVVMENAGGGE